MATIVTLTLNPSVDRSTRTGRVVPEDKLRCERPRDEPGGGGINVARALAEMDCRATAVHTSGGPAGQRFAALLDEHGLDHRPIPIRGDTRINVTVFETVSDRDYRFVMPGPEVRVEELAACADAIFEDPPDWLVASGSLPPGAPEDHYATLAARARAAGTRFVLDTSGAPLRRALDAGVFLAKPNLRELRQLVDQELTNDDAIRGAARDLVARGAAEIVLVSMGASGVWLVHGAGAEHIPAPTVPIQSRVGAGDSTTAGMVAGLARGWPPARAARLAIAAGAAAVITPGTELCRGEDVTRLFEAITA